MSTPALMLAHAPGPSALKILALITDRAVERMYLSTPTLWYFLEHHCWYENSPGLDILLAVPF
jgi:hypothetical protein